MKASRKQLLNFLSEIQGLDPLPEAEISKMEEANDPQPKGMAQSFLMTNLYGFVEGRLRGVTHRARPVMLTRGGCHSFVAEAFQAAIAKRRSVSTDEAGKMEGLVLHHTFLDMMGEAGLLTARYDD